MKRNKRYLCMMATLVCMAIGFAIPAFAGEPTDAERYQIWETVSVEDLVVKQQQGALVENQRYRLIGDVLTVGLEGLAQGSDYLLMGNEGAQFSVKCSGPKPLNQEKLFLTATLQFNPAHQPYLAEAHAWTIYDPANIGALGLKDIPSTEDYRTWIDCGKYEYAVENMFRRFFIKGEDGERLPPIEIGDWSHPYNKRTTIKEIQTFLDAHRRAICSQCHRPLPDCICTLPLPPPQFCSRCHRPLENCICNTNPVVEWLREYGMHAGIGIVALLLVAVLVALLAKGKSLPPPPPPPPQVCPKCHQPLGACICDRDEPRPQETEVLVNGVRWDKVQDKETVVLSPYCLKVLQGGSSTGKTLPLPAGEIVVGRAGGHAPNGAFLQLDMSDRPDQELHCSRQYAKFTVCPGNDSVSVEVMNKSGNPVWVDGRVMTTQGDSTQAKPGNRIRLNPDWEFELVKRT